MIDRDFKEQVRERIDIVELINAYVPLQRAGATFKACCPFHQEKTPSFVVSPERQSYHCFGCGVGGDAFSFVMEHEAMDFMEALRFLADRAGLKMPEPERRPRAPGEPAPPPEAAGPDRNTLYQMHDMLAQWYETQLYSPGGREALDYLYGRGLDDEWIRRFRLGYAPDSFDATLNWGREHGFSPPLMVLGGCLTQKEPGNPQSRVYDRWRHRLMFPIHNAIGRVIAFSGRQLRPDERSGKYVNSPETPIFSKSSVLYGLHLAKKPIRDAGYALLCEGQMDVIACHVAGLTNAVAPQGTAFTEGQARLLKRYADRLVLCFDADAAGIKAARRSVDAFVPAGLHARVVSLDTGQDPDSIVRQQGPDALRRLVEKAQDFFIFLLDQELAERDARDPGVKAEIADNFVAAIAQLPNAVMRREYCGLAASRLGVSQGVMFQQLNAAHGRRRRQARFQHDPQAAPPPAPPRRSRSPRENAELVLLDLALHHEHCARRMLDELADAQISETPIGHALSDVMAMTAQGEWQDAGKLLVETLIERPAPVVSRLLHRSPNAGLDEATADQACIDSLATLRQLTRDEQLANLQARLRNSGDTDEKRAIFARIVAIQRGDGPCKNPGEHV